MKETSLFASDIRDLGFRPGRWPQKFLLPDGIAKRIELPRGDTFHLQGEFNDGKARDFSGMVYLSTDGETKLTVWNT